MNKLIYVQGFAEFTIGDVFNFKSQEMREHLTFNRKQNRARKLA